MKLLSMVREYKYGRTVQNMTGYGEMERQMVKGLSFILMEMFMRVNLRMIEQTDMEFTIIRMDQNIKVLGKMI